MYLDQFNVGYFFLVSHLPSKGTFEVSCVRMYENLLLKLKVQSVFRERTETRGNERELEKDEEKEVGK